MGKTKTKLYTKFGKEVAKALIDKDWDNEDLAKELGISSAYITDILKGTRVATKQKQRIVEILNLNIPILE